jgi:hypothetical protein
MTAELIERCKEVLLLDEKRTQGEWQAKPAHAGQLAHVSFNKANVYGEITIGPLASFDPASSINRRSSDAAFIAAAPTIAALLRECVERIQADKAQEAEPRCTEADGCPTELAVLQRFWREHQ